MRTLIVYDTEYGNTEQVAKAIGAALEPAGEVTLVRSADGHWPEGSPPDLLLLGGPTQVHGLSPRLKAMLARVPERSLAGVSAATFDTRYHYPRLFSGSAATAATRSLRKAGCRVVAPAESFFVEAEPLPEGQKRQKGERPDEHLSAGELERAAGWAQRVAAEVAARSAAR